MSGGPWAGLHSPTQAGPASPRAARLGLVVLLLLTAVLYLWDLDESGYANDYYAAAAQAGATSWKAFLFGSLYAGNAITVDKTPLALWPMGLSVRVLGLSSFSVLLPQAIEGVATVAVLHATVLRSSRSHVVALLAGTMLALTPIAALVFRYDNPDALLVLLLVGAAACTLHAVEIPRPVPWLVLGGALVGLGFLTKMLEALVVVPALVAAYGCCARTPSWPRRVGHLLLAGTSALVAAGWWVLLVELWPAGQRPWIGGSQHNSVLEVAVGYNGVGRLTGHETTSPSTTPVWHWHDIGHVFTPDVGTATLWFLPAAVLLGVVALLRSTATGDRGSRAALTLWLVWLGTAFTTFAVMAGIFHSYYTVLLSPAIAASSALGAGVLSHERGDLAARWTLGSAAVLTGLLTGSLLLLAVGPGSALPWVSLTVLVAGGSACLAALTPRASRYLAATLVSLALAAPCWYTVATALEAHNGSGPHAGPGRGNAVAADPVVAPVEHTSGLVALPIRSGQATDTGTLVTLLSAGNDGYRWAAAVGGARAAASLQLAVGSPMMAIGGYKGTDPTPDLPHFTDLVARGEVHYFVDAGVTGPAEDHIRQWVSAHFEPAMVGGLRVYDLG